MRSKLIWGVNALLGLDWVRADYAEPNNFDPTEALVGRGIRFDLQPGEQQVISDNSTCASACTKLRSLFPSQITFQGSPESNVWSAQFWSQHQQAVKPSCVFRPENAADISVALLLSRESKCPFAVKSGGHAAFAGASSVPDGISIDLTALNGIELTDDRKIAKIGPGNLWYHVYKALDEEQLTVVGGRVADIGVGGLTLGGGISFFSGAYGWACDNVVNYEVVIASGDILHVNESSHPDLYWALRGGGNNFGIVTRFDLETYPQGSIWGGSRTYDLETHSKALIDAFVNFGNNPDDLAATWVAFVAWQGMKIVSAALVYHEPIIDPPVFKEFKAIPHIPDTDSTKIRSLSDMVLEVNATNPKGMRQMYWTHTFKLSADLANFIIAAFTEEVEPLKELPGFLPAAVFQVATKHSLSHMAKRGGNPIPLTEEEGPFMNLIYAVAWPREDDDDKVISAASRIMQRAVDKAKEMGLFNEYIYMNYASQYQDVLSSYGEENFDRLVRTAKKYDPEMVFQKLQPGYFKFSGAPRPNAYE